MSRPTFYRPPLIRQVLPWLFVLVFFITAPLLIFYTSGYRYNLKKGLIERNGTLIVDSVPTSGIVFLDDRATGDKTPVTLQNMVPGWHTLRVERSGYSSWQERVFIRSERVTFANHIRLWRQTAPSLVWSGNGGAFTADALREQGLLLEKMNDGWGWRSWTTEGVDMSPSLLQGSSASSTPVIHWSADGQAALIQDTQTGNSWWFHRMNGRETAELLTRGKYHWSGNDLIGNTDKSTIRVTSDRLRFESTPHKSSFVEESQGLALQSTSSSDRLILVDDSFLTRKFALPRGNWSFGEILRPFILFHDREHWLAVQLKFGQPYAETVYGDYPRFAPRAEPPRALFLNGNELWLWTLGETPTLVWRQSSPLVQVAWHRSSDAIFVADQRHVFALNIDEGTNQTEIPLATFDQIHDMTLIGRSIYIVGARDQRVGIWELGVE